MRFHNFISYLLHPILFPLFGTLFYINVIPKYISSKQELFVLAIVTVGTILIPVFLLFFLKHSKMIDSFHLRTIEERKYPLLLFSFIGFLIGRLLLKLNAVDDLALFMISGSIAMLLIYVFLWYKIKVSIHMLGIGGFIGFIIRLSYVYHQNFLIPIAISFLVFGLLAKARLSLKAHDEKEVLIGFSIALLVQLILPYFYFTAV